MSKTKSEDDKDDKTDHACDKDDKTDHACDNTAPRATSKSATVNGVISLDVKRVRINFP